MKGAWWVLLAAGCSGTSTAPDVGGSWSGQWSSPRGLSGPATVVIEQHGDAVKGSFTMQNSPCITGGTVDGSLSGNQLTAHLVSGSSRIEVALTRTTDTRLDGTYDAVMAGLCSGDQGSVTLSR